LGIQPEYLAHDDDGDDREKNRNKLDTLEVPKKKARRVDTKIGEGNVKVDQTR
jgi:hypothetical protein